MTLPKRREGNYIGGVGGDHGGGGDLNPGVRVAGLVRVLCTLAIVGVLIWGRCIVVIDGNIVIVPDTKILLPSRLTGLRHRWGFCGGLGQLLGTKGREQQS